MAAPIPPPVPIDQRFAQLIQQFGLTKNSFAISLGKTASVVQHLIDGRNKPGFDLLCKVFEIYPNVSRDWLLLGRGPMLVSGEPAPRPAPAPPSPAPAIAATPLPAPEPLEPIDVSEFDVPPARRPAGTGASARLQPDEIIATLALAAAAALPAHAPAPEPAAAPPVAVAAQTPPEGPPMVPVAPAAEASPVPAEAPAAPAAAPAAPPAAPPVAAAAPAPVAPPPADTFVAAALHAQHLQHQLALAELRNQHLLEQQHMLREMLAMARQGMV